MGSRIPPDDPQSKAVFDLALRIGPRSLDAAREPELLARTRARAAVGTLEDAVLAELFERARTDHGLAEEFLRFVAAELAGLSRRSVSPRLRRLMDPHDLVQSVLGDLCGSLEGLRYESRPQFLALLARRLRWKRLDHEKRLLCLRRSEDLRVEPADDEWPARHGPSPATEALGRDEAARIALAIAGLSERDRALLRLQLRGDDAQSAAAQLDLSTNAVRKALERARGRLRAALQRRTEREGTP